MCCITAVVWSLCSVPVHARVCDQPSHFSLVLAAGGQTTVDDCRQWLKQLQEYVLHLTKQVQACTSDSPASDASSISSMDEAGSHTSSTAGTAAADATWRMMCQDAAEVLNRVADQMESGGATSSVSCQHRRCCGSTACATRCVY